MTTSEPPGRRARLGPRAAGAGLALLVLAAVAVGLLWPYLSAPRSSMAADRTPRPKPAPIDGARALGYLKQICAIGPRPAGSEANARQRQLVADHFHAHGAKLIEQKFAGHDPLTNKPIEMVNLVGSWFPERPDRVVIGAHYDTRPHPDMEDDPDRLRQPFLGANDGASGVALLMEIAHHLKALPTGWGVDLVLFDGEELVYGRKADINGYFLGSKEFARRYKASRRGKPKERYLAGIVLDMVGDRDLDIPIEGYSQKLAPKLVRSIWSVAPAVDAPAFHNEISGDIYDDHLPLNDAGIPTVDIIDFDYPAWHTLDDTPERCSADSLAQVGRVVTAWLAHSKPKGK